MFLHKKGVEVVKSSNILFTHKILHVLLFCFLIIWNLQSNNYFTNTIDCNLYICFRDVKFINKYGFEEARKCPKDNKFVILVSTLVIAK